MNKIKIFLASSNEMNSEREHFEIEIYRKTKLWIDEGYILHLDIWEDLSSKFDKNGSQYIYNNFIKECDIFILLACTKVGNFTGEEFEIALQSYISTKKPFIFTYFKIRKELKVESSLIKFFQKLQELKHYYSFFNDTNDLWNQFNEELDRLKTEHFKKNDISKPTTKTIQLAERIFKIKKIETFIHKGNGI